MPIIEMTMLEGRNDADIEAVMKAVATAAHESLGTPYENIRVIVKEVPLNRFSVGLELKSDEKARRQAAAAS